MTVATAVRLLHKEVMAAPSIWAFEQTVVQRAESLTAVACRMFSQNARLVTAFAAVQIVLQAVTAAFFAQTAAAAIRPAAP